MEPAAGPIKRVGRPKSGADLTSCRSGLRLQRRAGLFIKAPLKVGPIKCISIWARVLRPSTWPPACLPACSLAHFEGEIKIARKTLAHNNNNGQTDS